MIPMYGIINSFFWFALYFIVFALFLLVALQEYSRISPLFEEIRYQKKQRLNIIVNEIKSGQYSTNPSKTKELLKSKNKIIIQTIYENIEKMPIEEKELLNFLRKNKLEMNDKIIKILL